MWSLCCRSAQVFSQLLKIPTPVSSTLWSSASPVRSSLAATAAAAAGVGGLSGAGGTYSAHSSPVKSSIGMAREAPASPIMTKYASLLGTLA